MKLTSEITKIIQTHGKVGAEECEKYLNIDPIQIDKYLTAYQVCYFNDTKEAFAYCLDETNGGHWVSNLHRNIVEQIENQLKKYETHK